MTNRKSLAITAICALLIVIANIGFVFLVLAGLSYLVCIGFNIYWTWLMPVGLLGMIMLVGFICRLLGIK